MYTYTKIHIDGLAQDFGNSSALAMELLQFCAKSSIYCICICVCSLSGLSVDIFSWGSGAPPFEFPCISEHLKQNLKGPSIEIHDQFFITVKSLI